MNKTHRQAFRQITAPLKEEAKKVGIKQEEVNKIVYRAKKSKQK